MKLTKLNTNELSQTKEVPGLLACRVDYEIKSGKGQLHYTGPKFTPGIWHQVMSFFRWTNKEMDSESQVRLYVNVKLGQWGPWAFPQEARTGMSAREIVTQETPEQATERFASWGCDPSADWLYFCTVHHHCSASAFQSGTDEENERNQDGLHITVGRMDGERHDLHARFYLAGNCFEPDMALFWSVSPDLVAQIPSTMLDAVARFQMCEKVVVDFPDAWRKNVIGREVPTRSLGAGSDAWEYGKLDIPEWTRVADALREISFGCAEGNLQDEELFAALQALVGNPALSVIVEACVKHEVSPEDLLMEVQQHELCF